jgi:hypothetical protein
MAKAVTMALSDKLAATRADDAKQARIRRILEVSRATASRLSPTVGALDHGEMLYDKQGLPQVRMVVSASPQAERLPRHQSPVNFGVRFSKKADTASR